MKQSLNKSNVKNIIKTGIAVIFVYGGIIYLFLSLAATTIRGF